MCLIDLGKDFQPTHTNIPFCEFRALGAISFDIFCKINSSNFKMIDLGENYFGVTDYILLVSTLLISLLIGLYYGYTGKKTNEELLVGGRNMSIIPVAASVMVTYVSAVTMLGFPSEVYAHGGQIIMLQLASGVGFIVSAFLLIPFFYRMRLTSINEYLERRFESVWIRWLASVIFIMQQVMLSGVILYAPSLALETFIGIRMWMSVVGVGVCATIYTNIGGLKAVVWTDTFQCVMMLGGMLAIVWRGFSASGGIAKVFEVAEERGRMKFFDFTFDPFIRHNFWNFALGTGFYSLMKAAVHQLQVQRYSGLPSCSKAKQTIITSVPISIVIMSSCLLTGLALFAFYANCDPVTKGNIQKVDQLVPYFVVRELSDIPGMLGLFTSCLFSGVLSSISSSQNSLAAVTWEDFLSRIEYFSTMTPRAQTNVTRVVGAVYGGICIAVAFSAQNLGAIYTASFAVEGSTAGALYGVFFMGLFLPFVNVIGVIAGALSGLTAMSLVSVVAFLNKKSTNLSSLPVSIEDCPAVNATMIMITAGSTLETSHLLDEWPWKVFSLSYLLYPTVAASITISVGVLVSLLVRWRIPAYRKVRPPVATVHPLVRNIFRSFVDGSRPSENANANLYAKSNGENGIRMDPIDTKNTKSSAKHKNKLYHEN